MMDSGEGDTAPRTMRSGESQCDAILAYRSGNHRGQEPGDPVQFVARNALTKALGKNRVRGLEKSVPTLGFNSDNCSFYYAAQ